MKSSKFIFFAALYIGILTSTLTMIPTVLELQRAVIEWTLYVPLLCQLACLACGYWRGVRIYALACAFAICVAHQGMLMDNALLESVIYMGWASIAHLVHRATVAQREEHLL